MKILRTIALLIGVFAMQFTQAQSPVFSQYYTTGMYLNPALAGSETDIVAGLNYRAQWSQLETPYRTVQASYMHPLLKPGSRTRHMGGVGISIINDQAGYGSLSNTGFNIAGAYNLHLSQYGNSILSFGLQTGVYRNSLDAGSLQWGSQYNSFTGYDPNIPVTDPSLQDQRTYVVFNTGALWFYRKQERYSSGGFSTYLGASVYNLNQPNVSFLGETESLGLSSRVHGGLTMQVGQKTKLTPSFLLVHELNELQSNIGGYLTYTLNTKERTSVILGTWYRFGDSMIAHIGTEINGLRIAFSYDHNVSSFQRYFGNNGSYEFSLQFRIRRNQKSTYFSTPLI